MTGAADFLTLYDYRQRVNALYRERNEALARDEDAGRVWENFCAGRDALFREHPQSALPAERRASFTALAYYPYNPNACVSATLRGVETSGTTLAPTSGTDDMPLRLAGRLTFTLHGQPCTLALYWIDVYGGGLFLPFRDGAAPDRTYGGGRYLVDTVKGSDFPYFQTDGDSVHVTLDFNYAYNPSCAYDYRWVCPLAPSENHLQLSVEAGEMTFAQEGSA